MVSCILVCPQQTEGIMDNALVDRVTGKRSPPQRGGGGGGTHTEEPSNSSEAAFAAFARALKTNSARNVAQCMPGGPLPDPRSIAFDVPDPPDNDELNVDLEKLVAVLTRRLFGTLARRAELKLHCAHFCTAMILT